MHAEINDEMSDVAFHRIFRSKINKTKQKFFQEHRVVIPKDEVQRKSSRMSIVHFLGWDKDTILPFTPKGRSSSDPPLTFMQYCHLKMNQGLS